MTSAAFFDLDRTLLAGGSGPVLSEAMRSVGFVDRSMPGEKYIYSLFNAIGETLPAMALARQGATLARGRSQKLMRKAAKVAAPRLAKLVQPYARTLIAEHQAAGRPVVLATTTPFDMLEPFAALLGLDAVVATRWGVDADGTYDGSVDGHFVWSAGKLAAVRDWASTNGIDVAASYAYSDSVFDAPLLGAVEFPFAVNPDPRLVVLAAARRWPTLHLDVPPGVAKVPVVGLELQRLALSFAHPLFFPYARFDITGTELIPDDGPAILVGNHRSYFDVAALAVAIARTNRTVRFLGKKEVFDAPVVGQIAAAMGGIRVDRGTGSDAPLRAAADALEAGDVVAMMPQGTIPRGREFFNPILTGRWGAARLAAMTKSPIVPVGLWGTEKVWPRSARLPNLLNVIDPPTVAINVGAPLKLAGRSNDTDTKKMMKAIMALLPAEARQPYEPTAAEIARALPPGHRGDDTHESARRPGTD